MSMLQGNVDAEMHSSPFVFLFYLVKPALAVFCLSELSIIPLSRGTINPGGFDFQPMGII
jgi:hypothetical protein